jgi:hypothetical protein
MAAMSGPVTITTYTTSETDPVETWSAKVVDFSGYRL